MKYQIELTGSQMMALRTILTTHMHFEPDEVHIDCSQNPPVETKTEDLFLLLMHAPAAKEKTAS